MIFNSKEVYNIRNARQNPTGDEIYISGTAEPAPHMACLL